MLPTLQTPLATFFPSKKAPKLYLISENRWYCRASVRSCFPSKRTHISLSLCVCSVSVQGTAEKSSTLIQLNTDIMLLASLILNTSIAEITAQLLSLSYVYLISLNDSAIIRIFVQIKILEGRAGYSHNGSRFSHYFIFIPLSDKLSDNRNSQIYQWKPFHWGFSCIKIQYLGTENETKAIINNIGYVHFACSEVSWHVLQTCKQVCQ